MPSFPGIRELDGMPEFDRFKTRAQQFFVSGGGTLRGHYRLKTGWHTTSYVRCRELSADVGFSKGLSQALARFYRMDRFTDIISIGTSALRIGSLLSLLLSTRHSFTFGEALIRGELAGREHYTEYELEVMVPPQARVLLIDDILGVGSVIESVTKKLRGLEEPPEHTRAFCIYALGDQSGTSVKLSGVTVDYLVAFPDVVYRKEEPNTRTCEICKEEPYIAIDE
jgi:orotate phosphoribosyltransferase